MLCEQPARRATATRTAVCTGGCGNVLTRCRRQDPVCNDCREQSARRRSLAAPPDSEKVNLRIRQLSAYHHGVWTLVRAAVDEFQGANGRMPTGREYRRLERGVVHRLVKAGVPATAEVLPPAHSPAWDRMEQSLAAMVAAISGERLGTDFDPEKEFKDRDLRDDHADGDRRPADAGRVGDRPAGVAGVGNAVALAG